MVRPGPATLSDLELTAFTQRLLVGLIIAWFLVLAVRLLRMPLAAASPVGAAA